MIPTIAMKVLRWLPDPWFGISSPERVRSGDPAGRRTEAGLQLEGEILL